MAEIPVLEAAPKADKGRADKAKADKGGKAQDASSEGGAPAGGGKKKLLIFAAIGVIVLGGGGAGAWLMLGGKHDAADPKGKKEHVAEKEKKEAPKGPPLPPHLADAHIHGIAFTHARNDYGQQLMNPNAEPGPRQPGDVYHR